MTRSEESLQGASAKLKSLSMCDVMDLSLVVSHGCSHIGRVCRIKPDLVEASCSSSMIAMYMGKKKGYRFVSDSCNDLVQSGNMCSGIDQDRLVLTFDQIEGFRCDPVAGSDPCVLVNRSEHDVPVTIYFRKIKICLIPVVLG